VRARDQSEVCLLPPAGPAVFHTHRRSTPTRSTQETLMTTATLKLITLTRTLAFLGACAAMSAAPASFAAAQSDAAPSVTVQYNHLTPASPAGVDALYHRISNAASAVCPQTDIRDLRANAAAKRCHVEAVARAVQEINIPQLAVVHASRV